MRGQAPLTDTLLNFDFVNLNSDHIFDLLFIHFIFQLLLINRISNSFRISTAFTDGATWQTPGLIYMGKHDLTVFIDQDILWFDVPQDDIGGVNLLHVTEHVIKYGNQKLLREIISQHLIHNCF
jgi:hypothetical protein